MRPSLARPDATPPRPTLLCLHCSGSSGRQWDAYRAALEPEFELLSPDLLGYGPRAAWPVGRIASLDDEADALLPLLHARPEGVHLFGHSFGGAVALQLALRWPQRVRSLTLFEPVRFALLDGTASGAEVVGVGRQIGVLVTWGRLHEAAQRFVDYWSGPGTWTRLPAARRQLFAERMPKVHAEFETLFAERVPAARYAGLAMPLQLLGGERSPAPARDVLAILARQLPHARHRVLRGLGHMAPVTDPAILLAELGALIDDAALPLAA